MNRSKLLGLAVAAVLALTAACATSASAALQNFHFESIPTWLKGVQETKNVLTVSGGTVKCSVAEFISQAAISNLEEEEVVLHPVYGSCTAFGQSATVSTGSSSSARCDYTLKGGSEATPLTGSAAIVCSGGASISIALSSGECSVSIAAQTPGEPVVTYASAGSGASRAATVTSNLTKIAYSTSGGNCGASGTNGTYTGTAQIKGYASSTFTELHGFWVGVPVPPPPPPQSFHFESSPTWLRGVQETKNVLTVSGGTVKCSVVEFLGNPAISNLEGKEITLHPLYSVCSAFGRPAIVSNVNCDYTLRIGSEAAPLPGSVSIVCSGGASISIVLVSGECSVSVAAQTPGEPMVTYGSAGSGASRAIIVTSNVAKIAYSSSGAPCGFSGTNGTYTGSTQIKGYASAAFTGQHGVWVE